MELFDDELKYIKEALSAPALWPFSIIAGDLGLEKAIAAVRNDTVPLDTIAKLAEGFWTLEDVPSADTLELIVIGARVTGRRRLGHRDTRTVPTVARDMGIEPSTARRGLEMLRRYCASTMRTHKEFTRR